MFQSDLSCSGGDHTTGNESGIYSFASTSTRMRNRQPSPARRTTVNISNRNESVPRNPVSPARRAVDRTWNSNFADHAVVLFDHKKTTPTELSLGKSQV
jgi:hypothetical protein